MGLFQPHGGHGHAGHLTGRRGAAATLGWVGLLAYLPLILLVAPAAGTLPGLAARVGLFHGVGALWSGVLIARSARWPRLRPLFRRPLPGLLLGAAAFGLAAVAATALLGASGAAPGSWPREALRPFDLSPIFSASLPPLTVERAARAVLVFLASFAEEWIFRCALWVAWLERFPSANSTGGGGEVAPAGAAQPAAWSGAARPAVLLGAAKPLVLLGAGSLYFALLHAPQGAPVFAQALLGSLALAGLLWWRGDFFLIATLHALFNWRAIG